MLLLHCRPRMLLLLLLLHRAEIRGASGLLLLLLNILWLTCRHLLAVGARVAHHKVTCCWGL